jgi:hypothetical protein
VLIVQEANRFPSVPDDEARGGSISLLFPDAGGKYISEIGLLDIDERKTTVVVIYDNVTGGNTTKNITVPNLRDNSFQVVKIDIERVTVIKVVLTGSGAVTHVKFCSIPILTSPPIATSSPTANPTASPTAKPTLTPTPPPTKYPTHEPTKKPTPAQTLPPTAPPTKTPTPAPMR